MPLSTKLTRSKAKVTKKPVTILPNKVKTLPKIPVKQVTIIKSFQDKLNQVASNISIDTEDLPEELQDIYDDFEEEIKPELVKKNWKIWAAIFAPLILPGLVQGMRSEPSVKQPPVIIKGKQQEVIPPVEPKSIIDFSKQYFENHGLELCKSLTETDLARMKQDLQNNWGKGEDAFAKTFQDSYPVSRDRLETIYRSERHMAEYHGVLERARLAGHSYKQYRAVGDERTCDLCMSYDMEIVPIDEPFSNGEMTANSHPNCRCSLVTLTDDEYDEGGDEEIQQDASYLNEVSDFMKLNYKCPEHNGSWTCDKEEQDAVSGYVRAENVIINSILSNDFNLSESDLNIGRKKIKALDKIFSKVVLPEKEITYRGISQSNIKNLPDNWNKIGDIASTGTFLSTSKSRSQAEGFITGGVNDKSILIKLELPKGTNAIHVSDYVPKTSSYAYSVDESETLVGRNTKFKVIDYKVENSKNMGVLHVVTWQAIPDKISQDQSYLDSVASFMKLNYKCEFNGTDNKCDLSELENFSLGTPKVTKPVTISPTQFIETDLTKLTDKSLTKNITDLVHKTTNDIPEIHGIPFTVQVLSGKEFRLKSGSLQDDSSYAAHDTGKLYLNEEFFNNKGKAEKYLKKDELSGFHPTGCNTLESIISHEMGHIVFTRLNETVSDKSIEIDNIIRKSYESGELGKVSRYAELSAKEGDFKEAEAEIFASIYHTPEKDQEPVVKTIAKILKTNSMKYNTLIEAADFIKLNYNCPNSEKVGEGPGSCSGKKTKNPTKKSGQTTQRAWHTGMQDVGDNWYSIRSDREEKQQDGRHVTLNKVQLFRDGELQDYWQVEPNPGGKGAGSFEHDITSTFKNKDDARKQADRYLTGELKALDYYEKKAERDITDLGLDPKKVQELSEYTDKEFKRLNIQKDSARMKELAGYHGTGFLKINKELRSGQVSQETKEKVTFLDDVLNSARLPDDMVLFRGVQPYKELKQGDILQEPGFMSTSLSEVKAREFGIEGSLGTESHKSATIFEIHVSKGLNGLFLDSASHIGEAEVLLSRGLQFKVLDVKVERDDSQPYSKKEYNKIIVEPIKQKQDSAYLNEVAEFIKLNTNPNRDALGRFAKSSSSKTITSVVQKSGVGSPDFVLPNGVHKNKVYSSRSVKTGLGFPVAPLDLCYDGSKSVAASLKAKGFKIKFGYRSPSSDDQGHMWVLASKDGNTWQAIDSYFGEVSQKEYYQPEYSFDDWDTVNQLLPKWQAQNAAGLLEDAFDFIKLNYNCPASEKTGEGPGSCSGGKSEKVNTVKEPYVKTSVFKPAKTVDEAQKFAEEYILNPKEVARVSDWNSGKTAHTTADKVQQIKLISYRGIDINVANTINKQMIENIKLGLPQPNRIITTQLRKTPNTLMRMSTSGQLEINTIAIGNFKKIESSLEAGRKLNGPMGKDLMTQLESHIGSMTESQMRTYDDIKETLKYSRAAVGYEVDSNPERCLQSTINHETAHMLEKHGKYGYDQPQHEEFRNAIREMAKITVNSDYKYKLSSYGCKDSEGIFHRSADPDETFAELYSAYRFHEDDNIHPDVLKLMKHWLPER